MPTLRVVLEHLPKLHADDLVVGATYLIRRRTNLMTHAVYLRVDRLYVDIGLVKRKYRTKLYVFRQSSSGEEIYVTKMGVPMNVIKEVTGLEGIIAAGDIDIQE